MKKWKRFDGTYDKVSYMIFTVDGLILGPCWPNAGTFHVMSRNKIIDADMVVAVKEYE